LGVTSNWGTGLSLLKALDKLNAASFIGSVLSTKFNLLDDMPPVYRAATEISVFGTNHTPWLQGSVFGHNPATPLGTKQPGAFMPSSEPTSLWWDRDVDECGRPLRTDVREAAHQIWTSACGQARRMLGEDSDAPELIEGAVKSTSQYLDKRNIPLYTADTNALVALAFRRSLRRLARRRARLETLGSSNELAEIAVTTDLRDSVDRHLFLEQLTRELNPRSRGVLRLRLDGFDWKAIARSLGMTPTALSRMFNVAAFSIFRTNLDVLPGPLRRVFNKTCG
jgi:hypothetical protein